MSRGLSTLQYRDKIVDMLHDLIETCIDPECTNCNYLRDIVIPAIEEERWRRVKPKGGVVKRKTPPPDKLDIPPEFCAKAKEKGWPDPNKHVDAMLAWYRKKGLTEYDWLAVLELWLIKKVEFDGEKPAPIPSPPPVKPSTQQKKRLSLEERQRLVSELTNDRKTTSS